jgi:hypothetical protein
MRMMSYGVDAWVKETCQSLREPVREEAAILDGMICLLSIHNVVLLEVRANPPQRKLGLPASTEI